MRMPLWTNAKDKMEKHINSAQWTSYWNATENQGKVDREEHVVATENMVNTYVRHSPSVNSEVNHQVKWMLYGGTKATTHVYSARHYGTLQIKKKKVANNQIKFYSPTLKGNAILGSI